MTLDFFARLTVAQKFLARPGFSGNLSVRASRLFQEAGPLTPWHASWPLNS